MSNFGPSIILLKKGSKNLEWFKNGHLKPFNLIGKHSTMGFGVGIVAGNTLTGVCLYDLTRIFPTSYSLLARESLAEAVAI